MGNSKSDGNKPRFEQYEYTPGKPHFRYSWHKSRVGASGNLAYHEEAEIHFVKAGNGSYFIGESSYNFSPSSLLVIPPNTPHYCFIKNDTFVEKATLMFPLALLGAKERKMAGMLPKLIIPGEDDFTDLEVSLRVMVSEGRGERVYWEESLKAELSRFVYLMKRAAESTPENRHETHSIVPWCLQYIESNFCRNISLEGMAAKAGYSHFHLSRIFKRCTGLSVKQFILHRRVLEARRLLVQEPLLTIEALALRLGFTSLSHLNRCFKKTVDMTPGAYRTMMHSGGPE